MRWKICFLFAWIVVAVEANTGSVVKKTFYADGSKDFTIVKHIKKNECTCSCKCVPDSVVTSHLTPRVADTEVIPTEKTIEVDEEAEGTARTSGATTAEPVAEKATTLPEETKRETEAQTTTNTQEVVTEKSEDAAKEHVESTADVPTTATQNAVTESGEIAPPTTEKETTGSKETTETPKVSQENTTPETTATADKQKVKSKIETTGAAEKSETEGNAVKKIIIEETASKPSTSSEAVTPLILTSNDETEVRVTKAEPTAVPVAEAIEGSGIEEEVAQKQSSKMLGLTKPKLQKNKAKEATAEKHISQPTETAKHEGDAGSGEGATPEIGSEIEAEVVTIKTTANSVASSTEAASDTTVLTTVMKPETQKEKEDATDATATTTTEKTVAEKLDSVLAAESLLQINDSNKHTAEAIVEEKTTQPTEETKVTTTTEPKPTTLKEEVAKETTEGPKSTEQKEEKSTNGMPKESSEVVTTAHVLEEPTTEFIKPEAEAVATTGKSTEAVSDKVEAKNEDELHATIAAILHETLSTPAPATTDKVSEPDATPEVRTATTVSTTKKNSKKMLGKQKPKIPAKTVKQITGEESEEKEDRTTAAKETVGTEGKPTGTTETSITEVKTTLTDVLLPKKVQAQLAAAKGKQKSGSESTEGLFAFVTEAPEGPKTTTAVEATTPVFLVEEKTTDDNSFLTVAAVTDESKNEAKESQSAETAPVTTTEAAASTAELEKKTEGTEADQSTMPAKEQKTTTEASTTKEAETQETTAANDAVRTTAAAQSSTTETTESTSGAVVIKLEAKPSEKKTEESTTPHAEVTEAFGGFQTEKLDEDADVSFRVEPQESKEIVAEFNPNDDKEKIRQDWRKALVELRRRLKAHLEKRRNAGMRNNKKTEGDQKGSNVVSSENKDENVEEQTGHRYVIQVVRTVAKDGDNAGVKSSKKHKITTTSLSTEPSAPATAVTEAEAVPELKSTTMETSSAAADRTDKTTMHIEEEKGEEIKATSAAVTTADSPTSATKDITQKTENSDTTVAASSTTENVQLKTTEAAAETAIKVEVPEQKAEKAADVPATEAKEATTKNLETEVEATTKSTGKSSSEEAIIKEKPEDEVKPKTTAKGDSSSTASPAKEETEAKTAAVTSTTTAEVRPTEAEKVKETSSKSEEGESYEQKSSSKEDAPTASEKSHEEKAEKGTTKEMPELAMAIDEEPETRTVLVDESLPVQAHSDEDKSERMDDAERKKIERQRHLAMWHEVQRRRLNRKNQPNDEQGNPETVTVKVREGELLADRDRLEAARLLREEQQKIDRLHELRKGAALKAELERQEQINRELEDLAKMERRQRELIERQQMAEKEKLRLQRLKQLNSQLPQDASASESREEDLHTTEASFIIEDEPTTAGHTENTRRNEAKPLSLQCESVRRFAKFYEIDSPVDWVQKNCAFARQYFPKSSCEQLRELFSFCI